MIKKKYKPKSTFFKFSEIERSKNYKIFFHQGWHNIIILRIEIIKKIDEKNFLNHYFTKKTDRREKAIIITKGKVIIKKEKSFKKNLEKYDCLHTNRSLKNFEIKSKKGSQIFIILGKEKFQEKN